MEAMTFLAFSFSKFQRHFSPPIFDGNLVGPLCQNNVMDITPRENFRPNLCIITMPFEEKLCFPFSAHYRKMVRRRQLFPTPTAFNRAVGIGPELGSPEARPSAHLLPSAYNGMCRRPSFGRRPSLTLGRALTGC
jgi:hypothetical protein